MSNAGHQQDEAERLRRHLAKLKSAKGMTQAEFASKHKIPGGASMVSQHLGATRPINLEQAISYADGFRKEGLDCSVATISPRLAREVGRAAIIEGYAPAGTGDGLRVREPSNVASWQRSNESAHWPFVSVTRQEVESLSADQRHIIESMMRELLAGSAAKPKHRAPAKKSTRR